MIASDEGVAGTARVFAPFPLFPGAIAFVREPQVHHSAGVEGSRELVAASRMMSCVAAPRVEGGMTPPHFLDCAVLNYGMPKLEEAFDVKFQSVRGVFQEGVPAFAGSDIRKKPHIQIAVRDPACILGYFKPQLCR